MQTQNNFFVKSHGLGNEYVVFNSDTITFNPSKENIVKICNVNYGIGSDGLLLKIGSNLADFGVKIFNPDGSEAEKSGNGLRIFAKYLYDYHFTNNKHFTIETLGGIVTVDILEELDHRAKIIKIDIGKATFITSEIPVTFDKTECLNETLIVNNRIYKINCVSVGNPHCVIVKDKLDIEEIKLIGSQIEIHPMFPKRINVQFAKPINDHEIEVLIWERGTGFTLASGTSSSAVASVLAKLGLTSKNVTVKMLGGSLQIEIDDNWNVKLIGEVKEIARGILSEELFAE